MTPNLPDTFGAFDEELLTAYLDGEVDDDERRFVEQLLAVDASARALHDDLAGVRSLLRSLPVIEPPFGFLERLELDARRQERAGLVPVPYAVGVERRRARGSVVASAAATVGLMALAIGFAPAAEATVPPVQSYMERHMAMTVGGVTAADAAMPMASMTMADADAHGGGVAMTNLAGMDRKNVFAADDAMQVVYTDGDHMMSVYAQPGTVAWNALPPGGTMRTVGEEPAWEFHQGGATLMVMERGAEVYTLVGAIAPEAVMGAGSALPETEPSLGHRARRVIEIVGQQFGW